MEIGSVGQLFVRAFVLLLVACIGIGMLLSMEPFVQELFVISFEQKILP